MFLVHLSSGFPPHDFERRAPLYFLPATRLLVAFDFMRFLVFFSAVLFLLLASAPTTQKIQSRIAL